MLDQRFTFSQHSLSDFEDCPRRFYLRHVAQQPWPLVETGPQGLSPQAYQDYLRHGAVLHRWIERYWLGITSQTSEVPGNPEASELALWWSRFLATDFSDLPEQRFAELALVAPLGQYRLYARFDLLALGPLPSPSLSDGEGLGGSAVIVDWKTLRGENPPSYDFLKRRLQTRVYLYVLATAGSPFNGGAALEPEQCAMRYWLANFPERPWVEIRYSRDEYEQDKARLLALIEDAAGGDGEAQFAMTDDERHCTYCSYRTLCRRRGPSDVPRLDEESEVIVPRDIQTLDY